MFCYSIRRSVDVIAERGEVDWGMKLRLRLRSWEWIWPRTLAFEALFVWVCGRMGNLKHCQENTVIIRRET